jgi:hypothetical protein
MADNITIAPSAAPSAKQVAADDVAGVLYQVVKLDIGTDGQSQPVTSAAGVPVADASSPYIAGAAGGVDVSTSSILVVPADGTRKLVVLVNSPKSTARVWLAFGTATATVDSGIPLAPGGSTIFEVQQQINAVAEAGGARVTFQSFGG